MNHVSLDFISPSSPANIILLSSDEPLLIRDYLDATRRAFRDAGFEEVKTLHVEKGFDWEAQEGSSNMSLFSSLSLTIYQFYSSKPGVAGAKGIAELCEQACAEDIIILSMPKLDARTKNSAWCKNIKKSGTLIELKPVYANQLVGWLTQRAQNKGLNLSHDAIRFLADRTEGNLLAADQELEKLLLIHAQNESLSLEQVAKSVANQARFTQFELADCCLMGDRKRALKILKNQQAEGVVNLSLMNALKGSIDVLSRVKSVINDAQALAKVWLQLRVWDSKKRLYTQAANRLSSDQIDALIQLCAKIDRVEKGQQRSYPNYVKLKPISADVYDLYMLELVNNFSGLRQ